MIYFDKKRKKILHFRKKMRKNFWDLHWLKNSDILMTNVLNFNPKSLVCRITQRFLIPEDGPILEGGCGLGNNVYQLKRMNFDATGIDSAKATIRRLKKEVPEIKVQLADVRKIPFPDNYFAGYWSLGVIEHFFEGYDEIAKEMKRVIKLKGYLFLSFPYMSPFRKLKVNFHLYKVMNQNFYLNKAASRIFYQYILNKDEVIKDFNNIGLKLKYAEPFGGIKGFKDEIFFLKFFIKRFLQILYDKRNSNFINRIKGFLDKILVKFFGHSILLVFQKF